MRRVMAGLGILLLVLVVMGGLSYSRASRAAAAAVCPVPAGTELMRVRLSPWVPPNKQLGPVWIFTYGPSDTPGHEGFQLFITPSGQLASSNPPDLVARLETMRERAGAGCAGSA